MHDSAHGFELLSPSNRFRIARKSTTRSPKILFRSTMKEMQTPEVTFRTSFIDEIIDEVKRHIRSSRIKHKVRRAGRRGKEYDQYECNIGDEYKRQNYQSFLEGELFSRHFQGINATMQKSF
uniref:Uncharacterized protein n=1 Tax=Ascaris lumbricoides TaxID=6252 RepID=A0A0M3ILL5_ASCLU